ncbi:MAG TPA: 3-deoxy-D-manno-octulosonic acid transferase [Pyrinomonadaceae bacterium]|jgi:3-deoxy-D-manno-octulosonic-acid transferase
MLFLYSLLLTLGIVALLPRFIYDALRHGKYIPGLRQRLGQLPLIETGGRPVIWLHCVSVGETQAARPLVRAIRERFPTHALVVSTTTMTGQRVALEAFREEAAAVLYFPFDWGWSTRRALRAVNPSAVLIMETELWPRFLFECRARRVPVALLNGRLSEKSFRNYRLILPFIRRVVNCLDLALMQTETDAARLSALGLAPERLTVTGNVKFDADSASGEQALTEELRERFSLSKHRPLIVAASTHAPEERVILSAFKQLRAAHAVNQPRLLLAPRHPERFAEVASLIEASGLSWSRRSAQPGPKDVACDVILLDSIGELRAVYTLAAVVFVGGSIARTGGHNVLEPAATGSCILTGHHTFNFASIIRAFREANALVQLPPLSEEEAPHTLTSLLKELLADEQRRHELGARALELFAQNRGATERTLNLLTPLLAAAARKSERLDQPGAKREGAFNA